MVKNLPPIPDIPKNVDPELKAFLLAIKEIMQVREGVRGPNGQRFVTKDELTAAINALG